MKSGWEMQPLENVCIEITDGSHFSPKTTSTGDFPYITVRDIDEGVIDFSGCKNVSNSDYEALLKNGCKPNKGDVLFSKDGTVGKVALVDEEKEFVVLSSLAIIRPNSTKVHSGFLSYMLQSPKFLDTAIGQKTGVAIRRIILKNLKPICIPTPPLPEQKRIVAILDEAFEGIATATANAAKNLANAREVFQSKLNGIFGNGSTHWAMYTLSEVASDFGRGKSKHRPRNDPKLYGGKYPFIQTGDIRNSDHFITEHTQTYNDAGLAQSKLWPKGTLCITIAANIAETGILAFDSCFPDSVIGFVADPTKSDVHFVEYLLTSFKSRLQAKGKGSAQDNLNLASFENEKFPFPSVIEQKAIAAHLDALSVEIVNLENIYQQKLDALAELKKSILHQAFTGQLN